MSLILDNYEILTKEIKSSINSFMVFNNKSPISNIYDGKNIIFTTKKDEVYVFGENTSGCLIIHKNPIKYPTLVRELSKKGITEFYNGAYHMFARNENNEIYCWGANNLGQLGRGDISTSLGEPVKNEILSGRDIIDVCCGDSHTLARTKNGEVYAWGNNKMGQVGNDSNDKIVARPTKLNSFFKHKIASISCGSEHSMALSESGLVFVWGSNNFGQTGLEENSIKPIKAPQSISLRKLKVDSIKKISCGSTYSCLLSNDGFIFVFGKIVVNKIERKEKTPYRIFHEEEFVDIATDISCPTSVVVSKTDENSNFYEIKDLSSRFGTEAGIKSVKDYFASHFKITLGTIRTDIKNTGENTKQPSPIVIIQPESRSNTTFDRYTSEFEEIKLIGKGTYGKVFKVLNKLDKQYYAVKKIDWEDVPAEIKNLAMKELEMMAKLNSDYVVQYKNSWSGEKLFFIQMEFCMCTLKEVLQMKRQQFNRPENEVIGNLEFYLSCELFKELVQCINFLHTHEPKIIHRDLKPSNILVTDGRNKRFVKIADFGISVFHEVDDKTHTALIGTKKYVAPEVEQGRVYGTASDIYGLGVITEEIFDISLNSNVELKRSANSITVENYELICDLIDQMRSPRMTKRPSCEKLLKEIGSIPMDFGALKDDAYFDKYASSHETSNIIEENFYYLFLKAKLKFV